MMLLAGSRDWACRRVAAGIEAEMCACTRAKGTGTGGWG